jgi:hypothetical protein
MKKILLTISSLFAVVAIIAYDDDAPCGRCNDPAGGRQTCKSTNCHPTQTTLDWGTITSTIPGSGYIPGNTYTITATVTRANHSKFGFEVSDQTLSGISAGALMAINSQVQIKDSLNNHYATQTGTGVTGSGGSKTWQFNWVAPPSGTGTVRFFGAFNVTNNNNSRLGDTIVLDSLTVNESVMGLNDLSVNPSNIRIFPNPAADFITAEYYVGKPSRIELMLVDSRGANISLLHSEENFSGDFRKSIELKEKFSSGIYYVKTTIGEMTSVQKLVIL